MKIIYLKPPELNESIKEISKRLNGLPITEIKIIVAKPTEKQKEKFLKFSVKNGMYFKEFYEGTKCSQFVIWWDCMEGELREFLRQ